MFRWCVFWRTLAKEVTICLPPFGEYVFFRTTEKANLRCLKQNVKNGHVVKAIELQKVAQSPQVGLNLQKNTTESERLVHLKIAFCWRGTSFEPNLHDFGFNMLIFGSVKDKMKKRRTHRITSVLFYHCSPLSFLYLLYACWRERQNTCCFLHYVVYFYHSHLDPWQPALGLSTLFFRKHRKRKNYYIPGKSR